MTKATQEYRGVKITCEIFGAISVDGGVARRAMTCSAKVGSQTFKGSLPEVKADIDVELGPIQPKAVAEKDSAPTDRGGSL